MGLSITGLEQLGQLAGRLREAAALDLTDVMEEGGAMLLEDNERGLLAGLDCDEQPMPPTQRETTTFAGTIAHQAATEAAYKAAREAKSGVSASHRQEIKAARGKLREAKRAAPRKKGAKGRKKTGAVRYWERRVGQLEGRKLLVGERVAAERNLASTKAARDKARKRRTSRAQTEGAGPPLVPHGAQSRAIRLLEVTEVGRDSAGWYVLAAWDSFDSKDGRPILEMHANPIDAPYPKRDVISKPRPSVVRRFQEHAAQRIRVKLAGP